MRRLLALVILLASCAEPTPAPPEREAVVEGAPMEPLQPRPPVPEPPPRAPQPTVQRTLFGRVDMLGYHRFYREPRVLEGAWEVDGVMREPGHDRAWERWGGERLEGCRASDVDRGSAVWCPGLGVVGHAFSESNGWQATEQLLAIQDDGGVRATTACVVLHLLDGAERAACDAPVRSHGIATSLREATPASSCRWRFTPDGPVEGRRRSTLTLLLGPAAAIEARVEAEPDDDRLEGRGGTTWLARAHGWAAAVTATDECGASDLSSLAARLLAVRPRNAELPE